METNNQKPITVMVIEDHPDQRELLEIVLQKEGYRVVPAANGVEALAKLEREPAEVILSDVMMPKMDGFELMRKLRGNPSFKNVYIILITARIQERDRVQGLDLGADDYIVKPFSPRELVARVRAVLRRSQGDVQTPGLIRTGELEIDLNGHRALLRGEPVRLTRMAGAPRPTPSPRFLTPAPTCRRRATFPRGRRPPAACCCTPTTRRVAPQPNAPSMRGSADRASASSP